MTCLARGALSLPLLARAGGGSPNIDPKREKERRKEGAGDKSREA